MVRVEGNWGFPSLAYLETTHPEQQLEGRHEGRVKRKLNAGHIVSFHAW